MPLGPLSLADEVQIELIYHITKQTKEDLGAAYRVRPGEDVIELMVEKLERLGKKSGKGFYDYPAGTRKQLWPELGKYFPICESQPSIQELITRLLYIQSLETLRIMEEGVVADPRDADIGSILGWGFPIGLGGTISYIDMVGLTPFVAEADRLKQTYGVRFEPPRLLRDKAIRRESFYVPAGERSTEPRVLSRHEPLG